MFYFLHPSCLTTSPGLPSESEEWWAGEKRCRRRRIPRVDVVGVLDVSWLSGAWLPGRRPALSRPRNPLSRILRDASSSRSRYLDWIELNHYQSRLTIFVCCMRPPLIMTLNRHTPCMAVLCMCGTTAASQAHRQRQARAC